MPRISRRHMLGVVGLGMVATSCGEPPLPDAPHPTTSPETAVESRAVDLRSAQVSTVAKRALPRKVVGGYWPLWKPDAVRLRDLPSAFNVIYLFAGVPRGEPGAVALDPAGDARGAEHNLVADIAYARASQGRSVLLSVGGASRGIGFDSRATSARFVSSVRIVVDRLGGIDGLDLNTFEADATPNLAEYSWISRQLKSAYGPRFAITSPPAPWSPADRKFCQAMVGAGLMDLCGPQYYDGAGLATPAHITGDIGNWVNLVGADKLCVGFGIGDAGDYMTIDQCVATWNTVRAAHPAIRGAFVWNVATDESNGWGFANRLGPLVLR